MNATSKGERSEYSWHQFRALLARSPLNQAELAERLGRSRNWVNARATGREPITPQDAVAISQALGVGLSELMDTEPYRVLTRLAPVLAEVQLQVLDDPSSTDDEKQWLLRNIRELMNMILTNPHRATRKVRRSS